MPEPEPELEFDMILPDGTPLCFDMGPEFTWDGLVPAGLTPQNNSMQNIVTGAFTAAQRTAIETAV